MQIRQERPEDATGIRLTTDAAFKDTPYSSQTEAKIVDALRSSGALTLSLVASRGNEIIGHAAFSPVRINGADCDWYGLGPVSVRPDQQHMGIGQLLIRGGLRRLQAGGCVVFGDPAYCTLLYNAGVCEKNASKLSFLEVHMRNELRRRLGLPDFGMSPRGPRD
jgi:putative acetyltransferase